MSIYKRGDVYWYKFMWQRQLIRESTKQGNDKQARKMEAAHRTRLADGLVGIREKKAVPPLREFCEKRFEPWIQSMVVPKTWLDFYRVGLQAIKGYPRLANLRLDEITSEVVGEFAAERRAQKKGLQVSTVNSSLRVLRRILRQAVEWDVIQAVPRIRMLPGERRRERVVSEEEFECYLLCASPLVADVAITLNDTGLRPDECHRLEWPHITWINGRNGSLAVMWGKTAAARRVIPMTPRLRAVLESRWEAGGQPAEGFVWPASTKSGHIDRSTLKKQHARALKLSGVRPFLLYSLRHTFATRISPHVDAWTLCKIMGWSSLSVAMRYIHPSEDRVLEAISGLGGHKIGHTQAKERKSQQTDQLLTAGVSER